MSKKTVRIYCLWICAQTVKSCNVLQQLFGKNVEGNSIWLDGVSKNTHVISTVDIRADVRN
jgi:hypothetical protein